MNANADLFQSGRKRPVRTGGDELKPLCMRPKEGGRQAQKTHLGPGQTGHLIEQQNLCAALMAHFTDPILYGLIAVTLTLSYCAPGLSEHQSATEP